MTTDTDNKQAREGNESFHESQELTWGVSSENNYDPTGAYPRVAYTFGFSINQGATGADTHELWTGAGIRDYDIELVSVRPSVYPHNQVTETPAGHVISIDDTPGGERLLIKHATGSGIEMKPDGSVVISSRKNRVEVTDGHSTVIVKGDGNLVYEGNLNLSVTGDMNLDVGGDYNVKVAGQNTTNIIGSEYKRIAKSQSVEVLENNSITVLGNTADTTIGTRTIITNEKYESIHDANVIFNTSKDISISAENNVSIASSSFSSVSEHIGVIAHTGTLGGESVEHYGKTYSGPANGSGTQTTFYGTLVGLAHEANTSRYAKYSEEAWVTSGVARYAITAENVSNLPAGIGFQAFMRINQPPTYNMEMEWNQNEPEWRMPTPSMISSILNETDKGIVRTKIFDEEITLRTSFDDQYNGVFKVSPSMQDIRTAMRDENFREGITPPILVAQGLLDSGYVDKLPENVNRAEDKKATSIYGTNKIGNSTETNSSTFKVRK